MRETALIVEVPEAEASVREWRWHHDPVAQRGVPGHVTVLYPFVPVDALDDVVLDVLAGVVGEVAAFDYELSSVDEFDGVVWLRPEPDEPFRDLTRRLWAAFPEYPPYGGRFADTQPHLTLAVADADEQPALAARLRADLGPHLPIACTAEAVSVFVSDARGTWRRTARLLLRA